MTHKQDAMTMVKPWPQVESFRSHLRKLAAHLRQIVEIPCGYEDNNGFHFGTEPAMEEIRLPRS